MKVSNGTAFKKLLSLLVAAVMVFGLVPFGRISVATRNAAAEPAPGSVVNGRYVDGVWTPGGNGSITHDVDGTDVTLSKTATQIGENTYQVTLKVETSTSTSQVVSSEDGAVVLVIDRSGSMKFCEECGAYTSGGWGSSGYQAYHLTTCSHYAQSGSTVHTEETRMYAAKQAAKNFLQTFAGTNASARRMVAVVTFATDYTTDLQWVNVAGGAGHNSYNAAVNAIDGISANGGTNLEGGLYTAYQRLGDSVVSGITAKNVVVLTDGTPTYGMNGLGDGGEGSAALNNAAAQRATQVKTLATLYTICFGVADEYTYVEENWFGSDTYGPTVGEFLANSIATSPAHAYNADNASELTVAFQEIIDEITSGLTGEGWTVTDPMGSAVDFVSGPANFTTAGGETYTWSLESATTSQDGGQTIYVYTCTYTITVDPQTIGFVEGEYYPTNGPTYLNVGGKQYAFPVPGVTGCFPRTSVTVTKAWNDNNNQDGIRPSSVSLQLMKEGAAYGDPVTVNAAGGWSYTWNDLIAMQNGHTVNYTVVENEVPAGYTVTYGGQGRELVVTNTHEVEKTSITVTKVWNDNDNQDGIRPDSITVALKKGNQQVATGVLTAANGWTYTFEGLDKYEAGNLINYTVAEINVPEGYTPTVDGLVITNTHNVTKISVDVSKVWHDDNNRDGVRPNDVTIHLYANGANTGKSLILNAGNNWSGSFENIDKFQNGAAIAYTVTEDEIAGYTAAVTGNASTGFVVTNTHTPAVVEVAGSKTWVDNDNQDGARPASITVNLVKDGEIIDTKVVTAADNWAWSFNNLYKYENGVLIGYSVVENAVDDYSTTYDGYNIINTHTPAKTSVTVTKVWDDNFNQDGVRPNDITVKLLANGVETGRTLVLNVGNNWTGSFTELDKFVNGQVVTYTVGEVAIEGYVSAITGDQTMGYTITNTHTPAVVSVAGHKVWEDNNDQDGLRPAAITVNLLKNGLIIETVSVTGANGWAWNFTNLPQYENEGTLINYSVTEEAVPGYTTTYNGYDVINTHVPAKTSVTVTKSWQDNNDQDGLRPNDVTVKLLANGVDTGKTLVLNAGNNWTGSFADLEQFMGGVEVAYTVDELYVPGYASVTTGSMTAGYTITNSHTPAVTSVEGAKIWMDNDDQDGARPDSITVNLLANGHIVDTKVVTAADGWAFSFTGLPKFENHGTLIAYTVSELAVDGYVTTYENGNIINTHAPEKTSVSVTKAWADSNDQDGIRPNDVTVSLIANGAETGKTLVLSAGNSWTGTFEDLDKFVNGQPVVYTVAEAPVAGYEAVITGTQANGYTITNSHTPAVTEVSGHKTWIDNNDQDGARPASITISLLKNGQVVDTAVANAANGWAWSFTNLPKFENGVLINYTITEAAVEGYVTTYDGYDVTNSHAPAKTSVSVTKAWEDSNDQDGFRPNSVTVTLLANGVSTGKTLVLSEGNNWHGTFADLDKYADGQAIVYTVAEVEVPEYESVITGSAENGFVITNSHTPCLIDIPGCKEWFDNNNQDGVRPASITVYLLADGEVVDSQVVTAATNWTWVFTNVRKFSSNGTPIVYTFAEEPVPGYMTTYCFGCIKNTHCPEKTSVTVTKVWQDNNDQDGIRPNEVIVTLYANGVSTGRTLVLNAGNNWQGTFDNLDKYLNGVEIVYTVVEAPVPGYQTVINAGKCDPNPPTPPAPSDHYVITNSHTPAVTEVCGHKTWMDNNDQDGARPDSITINLLANGQVVDTVVVTAADNWSWHFTNLPKYEHGAIINYTVTEAAVEGYVTTYCGTNITNCHAPEKTAVSVTKAWEDSNDQDGFRPGHVTVELIANGVNTGKFITLNPANGWHGTFADLDKYQNGQAIVYTVSEVEVPEYDTVITGNQADGYVITNSHTPCLIDIPGCKEWFDNNNQDGVRPASITVHLLADGVVVDTQVVTAATNWCWVFTGVRKFSANGTPIVYTFLEDPVPGYVTTYCFGCIKNTHCPEKTSVTVTKVWEDNNDQDGIRPNQVIVTLYANGVPTGRTLVLSAANNWQGTFDNLDKYMNGVEIVYTVVEAPVPGYETVISGAKCDPQPPMPPHSDNYVITNSHTPAVTEVCGLKIWMDNNDQDGARPDSITIHLLANGQVVDTAVVTAADNWSWHFTNLPKYEHGALINYTVVEESVEGYVTTYCGNKITNCHAPEKTSVTVTKAWDDENDQDGIRPDHVTVELIANGHHTGRTIVLNAANNWMGTFEDLDKYLGGQEIVYTVSEVSVPGYVSVVTGGQAEGYVITNSHTPCLIDIPGCKEWFDNNNQDGVRPEAITVHLLANGVVVDTIIVTAETDWNFVFTGMPKFQNGAPIIYTFAEEPVPGYFTAYCFGCIKNTHCPEKTSITVTKVWDDNNNQDGIRPGSVTVELYANGQPTGYILTLSNANFWTGTFINLDKYANGELIEYTVVEVPVPGYETFIAPARCEGFVITNVHTPELIDIPGCKEWFDNDNQDGVRPESITVHLLANGIVVDTIVVTAETDWNFVFTGMPKYYHGVPIIYTFAEEPVPGYFTTYCFGCIKNTHCPEKTAVTVNKVWDDNDDQDGIRPGYVTVELYANGEPTGYVITLSAANNWQGTFINLDKYANGELIEYTVVEVPVPGYETFITPARCEGFVITNVHVPEVVEVAGSKTWVDNNNQDGVRPEAITINLLANGVVIDTITVTAEDGWAWSFTDLPKFENHGQVINYTVTEEVVEGYTTTYNAYNVVNEHAPEKTSVTVTKSWDDAGNQDGIRPYIVTVHLLANGEDTGLTANLGSGNGWRATFDDLDKFENGVEIVYTVEEEPVPGYETVISGDQYAGYTITNIHTPELIDIAGAKTWNDHNNQDGMRPESITINLHANGVIIDTIVVTEAEGWAWSFTNLPKYEAEGVEIIYTVTETVVDGYTTEIDGYNVINNHAPEKTSVAVNKVWVDENDQDGIRPGSVTVELIANGVPTGVTLVLNANNNWQGVFTDLDKYEDGVVIEYTVAEVTVEGYETGITGDQYQGYIISNCHIPEVVEVPVSKVWDDANNQDGARPDEITFRLMADGTEVEVVTVTAEDGWHHVFTDLPKYKDGGVEIVYTVSEDAVEGYSTAIEGNAEEGYEIINSYTPEEISIVVNKVWEGDNTKPKNTGHREDIIVKLFEDGEFNGQTITLTEENGWQGIFTGLPKYKDGEIIQYTVDEDLDPENTNVGIYYTHLVDGNMEIGFTITNTHVPVTGDERTAPTAWIGVMAVSALGAAAGAALFVDKKRKSSSK